MISVISYPIGVTDSLILPILKDSAGFFCQFHRQVKFSYIAITSKTAERWTFNINLVKLLIAFRSKNLLPDEEIANHFSMTSLSLIWVLGGNRWSPIMSWSSIIEYPRSLINIIFITNQYIVIIVCPLLSLPISHHHDHQTWVDGDIQIVFSSPLLSWFYQT